MAAGPRSLVKKALKSIAPNSIKVAMRNATLAQQSVKALGYAFARQTAALNLAPARAPIPAPIRIGLQSKCTSQADMESPWLWYWCQQLQVPVIYHRKLWELAYLLQVMWEQGMLEPGKRGLVFGAGHEPIPSLLVNFGVEVTITDQPPSRAEEGGWVSTGQFLETLDEAYHPHLADRTTFEKLISVKYVDMNAIDPELTGYDFCWSTCAFEHLGSIQAGVDFVANAMKVLKPGGIGIHTTEIATNPAAPLYETKHLSIFQQRHFEAIADRLRAQGDTPADMNFDLGNGPIDSFVDLPPYSEAMRGYMFARDEGPEAGMAHLRLAIEGQASTCYGLWARRGGAQP